jgi:bis(5'-nucleosyl)-tetraphosphatase (symmetrical)
MQFLLDAVEFDREVDTLWCVGDLINRGPHNLKTLRFIMDLGSSAVCVLGNHDLHFLAVATAGHTATRRDTIGDVLAAPELDEIVDWLRHKPLLHYDQRKNFAMVHAGLHPQWDIEYAMQRANEVETVLRGKQYKKFLVKMYGNKPSRWHDDLSGMKRLRVITNYFTRLRYCKKKGRLELNHKTNVAPKGYKPWFNHPREKQQDLNIVFGHWASLAGKVKTENLYALDTGCVWGKKLTLLRLEDRQRFSCPALRKYA